ncbi:hypothetical protein EJB05_45241, partial [Eragrostis curvula]
MEPPPAADDEPSSTCTFGRCFCLWRRRCSPRIPHVFPGQDYDACDPPGADADDRVAWSLLAGFTSSSSTVTGDENLLRLRRIRVARSGRVLGRSGDDLEALDDVDYDAKGT